MPDARQLSDQVLDALRLRVFSGRELGFTETALANLLGISRETVCHWWSAYTAHGIDALPHHRTGRPLGTVRLISDEQVRRIQQLLDDTSPDELSIAAPLWTRRAVRELIRQEFGIFLAVRNVGLYLQRWGFTPKKPSLHAQNQDPKDIRQRLEETYPAIEMRAAQEDAEIHFCDENGANADEHPGTGYARKGQPAIIHVPDPHIHINQIPTITNTGKVCFMTYTRTMNAALFLVFLSQLLRSTTGKLFLIVDRLQAPQTPAVTVMVTAHHDRIEVFNIATSCSGIQCRRVFEQ